MIGIVDYGLGNIHAIANIYHRLNIPVRMVATANELSEVEKIVLPGVGAFDWAITRLAESGMRTMLDCLVLEKRRPILGICVGMQMMATRSDEGVLPGLGWIDGEVKRFDESKMSSKTHLPHMGWNNVSACGRDSIFRGIETEVRFYFLHSYYFSPSDRSNILAETDYAHRFASAVVAQNIYGVQFHPEKSHQGGVQLLKNFAEL